MSRETTIQVRVSLQEKEAIREKAASVGMPTSQYLRALGLQIELGTPGPAVELEQAREAVENDPSSLNVTLDEKGSVVAKPTSADVVAPVIKQKIESSPDGASWINHRAKELAMRMSTRAALNQAKKEWEER